MYESTLEYHEYHGYYQKGLPPGTAQPVTPLREQVTVPAICGPLRVVLHTHVYHSTNQCTSDSDPLAREYWPVQALAT